MLAEIIAHKRRELHQLHERTPTIRREQHPRRSLQEALSAPEPAFIFEHKRKSPSRGKLTSAPTEEIIAAIEPWAAAISVLTDPFYFGGSGADLARVRELTDLPILAKDFFVDPRQVESAHALGADAILLIVAALGPKEFDACFSRAHRLGLECLVEVHDEKELDFAVSRGARLIGINNRNLRDLTVDLKTTERLAPRVPKGCLCVSESGVRDHADVRRLRHQVDGFLVGTRIMSTTDMERECRRLIFGRTKICGVTRATDHQVIAECGGDQVGLILVDRSPRFRPLSEHRSWIEQVPTKLGRVGVFADPSDSQLREAVSELQLEGIQLHGSESRARLAEIRSLFPECDIRKALPVTTLPPSLKGWEVDSFLLDRGARASRCDGNFNAETNEKFGGSGRTFDWSILRELEPDRPIYLAGGLNPGNAGAADAETCFGSDGRDRLIGLDASSGIERSPGIKDPHLIGKFFQELRGSSRSNASSAAMQPSQEINEERTRTC